MLGTSEKVDVEVTWADGHRTCAQITRPPRRSPAFTPSSVRDLLRALGIHRSRNPARRNRPALAEHEWWLRDLAAHLERPVRRRVREVHQHPVRADGHPASP